MSDIPVIRYIPVINSLTDRAIGIAENALELMFGVVEQTPVREEWILSPTHTELVQLIAEEMMEVRHQLISKNYPVPDGSRNDFPYWWDSHESQWLASPEGVYFNHHLIDNLDVLERDAYVMLAACHQSRTLAETTPVQGREIFDFNTPNLDALQMARINELVVGAYGSDGEFWTWGTIQGWNDDDNRGIVVLKTTDDDLIPVPGNRIIISDKSVKGASTHET